MNLKTITLPVFTGIIVVLGLGAIFYFGLYAKTSPDPLPENAIQQPQPSQIDISDWKTYRNEQFGFEFKYPPQWVLGQWREKIEEPPLYSEQFYMYSLSLSDSNISTIQAETLQTENLALGFQLMDSPSWRSKDLKERGCLPGNPKCITTYKDVDGIEMITSTFEREGGVYSGFVERTIEFKDKSGKVYQFHGRFNNTEDSISVLAKKELYMDRVADSFRFTQ